MTPSVNSLFQNSAAKIFLRVIHIDHQRSLIFYIRIFETNRTKHGIEFKSIDEFIESYGIWLPVMEDPFFNDLPENEISETDKLKRDERYEIIKSVVESPDVFYPRKRRALFNEVLKKQEGIKMLWKDKIKKGEKRPWYSRASIMDWVSSWWIGAMSKNSLCTNYKNSGGPGKTRIAGEAQRGRPRSTYTRKQLNVSEEIRTRIVEGFDTYYCDKPVNSLRDAYDDMIAFDFIHDKKIPSFNQFKDWSKKSRLWEGTKERRAGEIVASKDMRDLHGHARHGIGGPGVQFQIDSTKDNTNAVGSTIELQCKYIGRLTLYLVVDVFSSMIVGVALVPENSSYIAACLALLNAGSDKVAFCKSLGIPITYADWPCNMMPSCIKGDKGELFSYYADSITNNLKIKVENTPSYRAELKPIVERALGQLQHKLKKVLYKNGLIERGSPRITPDTKKDAFLNVHDLLYLIVKQIIHHNKYQKLEDYPLSEEMIEDNVTRTPLGIWNWGIENSKQSLKYFPPDTLWRNLLPQKKCAHNKKGVSFYQRRWISTSEQGKSLLKSYKERGNRKVTISYNPLDKEEVYLYHDRKFYPLQMRNDLGVKSLFEVGETLKNFKNRDSIREEEKDEHAVQTLRDQTAKVKAARARRPVSRIKTDKKDTTANRQKEKQNFRKELKTKSKQTQQKVPVQTESPKSGLPNYTTNLSKIRFKKNEK